MQHTELPKPSNLKRYEADFKEVGRIGKGGFSQVYKVLNNVDKNYYAMKKVELKVRDLIADRDLKRVQREARYLARLSHPRIIRYFNSWMEVSQVERKLEPLSDLVFQGNFESPVASRSDLDSLIIFEESKLNYSEMEPKQPALQRKSISQNQKDNLQRVTFYIQTEICKSTLEKYLNNRNEHLLKLRRTDTYKEELHKKYQESTVILNQIIDGLEYLHTNKLVHRDLKPGNIFMNSFEDVKIGDLGLVQKLQQIISEEDLDQSVCTRLYAAPEQLDHHSFDQRIDIYSLGIIILQLFFPMSTHMEIIKTIGDARNGILPDMPDEIKSIINQCLQLDPKLRPSLAQIRTALQPRIENDCEVQFEEEEVFSKKFVILNGQQLQVYKNRDTCKAQVVYNLNECHLDQLDGVIRVQHQVLMGLTIRCQGLHSICSHLTVC